jgi:hypothetical protein
MAIVDHIQWRRQMVSYALQRATLPPGAAARQADGFPPLCQTRCALGRWYYGDGLYFAGTPSYQALAAPHRHLHRVGERIVDGVRSGAALRDLATPLQDLKTASTELIRLLEDLEDLGLRALYTDEQQPH